MKRHLNLIPVSTQRRQTRQRVLRVWSTSVVLAGVFVSAMLGIEWVRGMSASRELQELDSRYAPFEKIAKQRDDLVGRISALRAREQLSLRLSRNAHSVSILGALATAARDSGGAVYVEQLRYGLRESSDTLSSALLTGAGVDSGAIAGFAERLRETGVFRTVAVESTGALPGGAASLRRFSVDCRL